MKIELKCPDCQIGLEQKLREIFLPNVGRHVDKWLECPQCKIPFKVEINIHKTIKNIEFKMTI